jgi:hypothetical protein
LIFVVNMAGRGACGLELNRCSCERQCSAIVRGTNRLHCSVAHCGVDFQEANRAKQFRPD